MAKILLIAGDLTQSDRMAAFLAQHDFDPAQVSRGDLAVRRFVGIAPRSWCWTRRRPAGMG